MTKQRKKGSGGKREGSGRKLKYGEEMKSVNFTVPISHIDNVKELVRNYLKQLIK